VKLPSLMSPYIYAILCAVRVGVAITSSAIPWSTHVFLLGITRHAVVPGGRLPVGRDTAAPDRFWLALSGVYGRR
jgi:hypothetical protein